jgi:hypothetical protein
MERAQRSRSLKPVRNGNSWEFYRDAEGWRWRRVDSRGNVLSSSTASFGHLLECAANARAAGYTAKSDSRFVTWPA